MALGACTASHDLSGCGFRPGMQVIVPGYCKSEQAIMQIAEAGQSSPVDAGNIMKRLVGDKTCQFWGYPHVMLKVEDVVHAYRDTKGRVTQVLRARPVNAPAFETYAIVLASRARANVASACQPVFQSRPRGGS